MSSQHAGTRKSIGRISPPCAICGTDGANSTIFTDGYRWTTAKSLDKLRDIRFIAVLCTECAEKFEFPITRRWRHFGAGVDRPLDPDVDGIHRAWCRDRQCDWMGTFLHSEEAKERGEIHEAKQSNNDPYTVDHRVRYDTTYIKVSEPGGGE